MSRRPLCIAAVFLLIIQKVFGGGYLLDRQKNPSPLEACVKEGETIPLTGTVSHREKTEKYWIYHFTDAEVRIKNQIVKESKILVYVKRDTTEQKTKIQIGNKVHVTGEAGFFQEAVNPGNFNQKNYYKTRGISTLIWADTVRIQEDRVYYVRNFLAELRLSWDEMLMNALGEKYGACISAVLLGEKGGLDVDLKERYQRNGIAHILAISGLHFSFIGYGFYLFLRKLGFSFQISGVLGIIFLAVYTILAGGSVSCIRALLMLLIRIGADMTGRVYDMPVSTAFAVLLIVLGEPLYLCDAGFLLSFGAVLGILLVYPVFEKHGVLPKFLCAGAAIQLMLLPILLNTYYETPVYALFLNLLVVPLMPLLLGAALAGSALAAFCFPGGKAILFLCKMVLWVYEGLCRFAELLPVNRIVTGQPPLNLMYLYYALLLICCFMCRKKGSKWGLRCFFFLWVLSFLGFCKFSHAIPGEIQVTAVDVGQGDGLYIRTPNGKHCLVDGGSTDISKMGKYRMIPFLKSQGVSELEYIFISHGDKDHTSAVEEILEDKSIQISVRYLVLPEENVLDESLKNLAETAMKTGTKVLTFKAGESLEEGGMCLTCLAPEESYTGETGNAASMVLFLEYKEFDMLFTGDIEGYGEKMLTENGRLKEAEVLKVAHHGSKNATTDSFLEETQPRIAVISAGKENSYGHPHEETLYRLEQIKCRVYNTQKCGAITIRTDGIKMEIITYLN